MNADDQREKPAISVASHFSRMCRTTKVNLNEIDHCDSAPPPSVTPPREEDSNEEYVYLFKLNNSNVFPDTIDNTEIDMIIDSGSTINIIDEKTFSEMKINYALRPSTTAIYPYNASKKLKIKGTFNTTVSTLANDHKTSSKFYVIPGKGGCLLGKETSIKLDLLRLGPTRLEKCLEVFDCKISDSIPPSTQQVLDKYIEVFKGMGKLKNYQQKLHIKEDVTPIQQTNPIPHT